MSNSYSRFPQAIVDSYNTETTPLDEIFRGYLRIQVKCSNCEHVSTSKPHYFQDLRIGICDVSNIDEGFEKYFGTESLEYTCEQCHEKKEIQLTILYDNV